MSDVKNEEKEGATELDDKDLEQIAGGSKVVTSAQISTAGLGTPASAATRDIYLNTPVK